MNLPACDFSPELRRESLLFGRRTRPAARTRRALLEHQARVTLNEPVVVEFTPSRTGDIAFACAMNMLRGTMW